MRQGRQAPAARERGTMWWLLVAVILLPMSGSVVDTMVWAQAAEPNAVVPIDPATPATALLVQILAVLGSIYALARTVVWMTPTPRDNEALGAVARWVRALAAATGMDPKQGVQKKS